MAGSFRGCTGVDVWVYEATGSTSYEAMARLATSLFDMSPEFCNIQSVNITYDGTEDTWYAVGYVG